MADDDLEFGFELVDEASSPAGKIHASLERIERDLKELDRASGKHMGGFGGNMSAAGVGTVALGNVVADVGLKVASTLGKMALAAGEFAARSALELGKASVAAVAFREKSELALSMLRHGESGALQFERIKDIALELGTPLEDTVKGFQKLAAMQFSQGQAETFFKRMQDLRAVGAGADETARALLAVTQIKATGKLQGDELLQLADAGVSVELVMQELAKATGKSVEEVAKLKEAGKISADLALDAIDKAIGKKTGAAVAGDAGKKFADSTITGMSDRLSNIGGILLDDIGKELKPALLELRPLLTDAFAAVRSDDFKAFLRTVGNAVGLVVKGLLELKPVAAEIFGGLTGDASQSAIMGVATGVRALLDAGKEAWPIFREFFIGFEEGFSAAFDVLTDVGKGLAEAFGDDKEQTMKDLVDTARLLGQAFGAFLVVELAVAAALGALIARGVELVAWFGSLVSLVSDPRAFGEKARELSQNFVDGLVNGLNAGIERVREAVGNLGGNALSALAGILRLGSPSKETDWQGQMAGAGLVGGVRSMIPDAQAAMAELGAVRAPPPVEDPIRIPAPRASGSAFGGGSANMNVNVNNTVNGAGDPKATGREVGNKTKGGVIDELERFAAELGA